MQGMEVTGYGWHVASWGVGAYISHYIHVRCHTCGHLHTWCAWDEHGEW